MSGGGYPSGNGHRDLHPVEVWQYLRPSGKPVKRYTFCPRHINRQAYALKKEGCTISAELLPTGQVFFQVISAIEVIASSIVDNGPKVSGEFNALITRAHSLMFGVPT